MKKGRALLRDETYDTLLGGRLTLIQKKAGYRFSLDALLLADFVRIQRGERIVDLGTGNGVIPLLLAFIHPSVQVVGVELQEGMVERALRGVALNRMEERVSIVRGDVCSVHEIFSPQSFEVVVSNPPYREAKSGRINPDPERRIARHEIKGRLGDFIGAASYLLPEGGRMALIYSAARMIDLLETMRRQGIEPKRLRLVHSFEDAGATLVLAEGLKGGGSELKVMPPLVVYTGRGKYTSEIRAILSGR